MKTIGMVAMGLRMLSAPILATVYATSATAGMSQDLASCTAAKGLAAAAACTRIMKSGRLPDEQRWIGHFNRGSGYRYANAYAKALADFSASIRLNPKYARSFQARALIHDELGHEAKALDDLARSIALDGKDWSAYYSRAAILRGRHDHDGALADLLQATTLASDKPQVALLRALIWSARGDRAEARSAINKVLAGGKSNASAYYARAAVAFDEQRLDAAAADLDRALALEDAFAAAHALDGRIREARGDKAGARQSYRRALELPPDKFDGRQARVIARERLKALGDTGAGPDVALVEPPRKVGCKRFLPATGMIIEAECEE